MPKRRFRRVTVLSLVLGAAAGLAACTAALQDPKTVKREPLPNPMNREQILARLDGNTIYRSGIAGLARWEYASLHAKSGRISARRWWSGGDDRAKGSWRITSDDLYCRRFDNFWARGELGCFRVYDASGSGEVIFDHVSGNQGDSFRYRYKVLAGNPYKL